MRYTHIEGIRHKKSGSRGTVVMFSLLSMTGGLYLLYNSMSPMIPRPGNDARATVRKLTAEQPKPHDNRVYIPQINVDIPIVPINGNETAALEKGAVHRAPTSGNPESGGNYVIAAHRFNIGLTPNATRARSPFYHIDSLKKGDQIYVDYEGERYVYEIYEKSLVPPTAVEIEQRTEEPRLTMYSCELAGPAAGREVVYAKPIGTVAWSNGKSGIKEL